MLVSDIQQDDSVYICSFSDSFHYKLFSSVQFSRLVVSRSLQPRGLQHDRTPCPSPTPGVCSEYSRKDWCWSWNSNTLATWWEELTHLKRPWCWERLKVGGEGDDRGWDGWMASPTQWTWVWIDSGSWWWTGRPGMLQFMGSQRVGHYWATELNWTEVNLSQTPNLSLPLFPFGNHKSAC